MRYDDLLTVTWIPGCYPSKGAAWYLERGKEIPDYLLPGRVVQRMDERSRELMIKLINGNPLADWWVKIMCGK